MMSPLNFCTNGDVLAGQTLIGRIDDDGDWRPEDDCEWTEDEVRQDLVRQIEELGDAFKWPMEQLTFSGVITH